MASKRKRRPTVTLEQEAALRSLIRFTEMLVYSPKGRVPPMWYSGNRSLTTDQRFLELVRTVGPLCGVSVKDDGEEATDGDNKENDT